MQKAVDALHKVKLMISFLFCKITLVNPLRAKLILAIVTSNQLEKFKKKQICHRKTINYVIKQ